METCITSSKQHSGLTDEVQVQRAQSGDQGAFEMLVSRYSALPFRLTFQLVRDEDLTYDVLQHVFLQLYRSLPRLQTGGALKGWLCQVARRRCIDELRRKRPIFFSEIPRDRAGTQHPNFNSQNALSPGEKAVAYTAGTGVCELLRYREAMGFSPFHFSGRQEYTAAWLTLYPCSSMCGPKNSRR